MRRWGGDLLASAWICLAIACQAAPDQAPASKSAVRAAVDGSASEATVYSYVDDRGRIHMAARIEDVPAAYRDQVVATDTGRGRRARLASDRVVVLDLRAVEDGKPLNYSVVDLSARLATRRAAPRQPRDPGELGRRLAQRGADRVRRLLGLAPAVEPVQVILYSAPWCGFCKKAAAYLRGRGVAFEERDIDASPAAAQELQTKLRQAGLRGGGIPVLDIDGTIVIGFDRARIEALLDG